MKRLIPFILLALAVAAHGELTVTNLGGFGARKSSSSAGSMSPDTISNLTNWFKADGITGLSDGTGVSSWSDGAPTPHNLEQATSANRPLYKTGIQNGLPCVRFSNASTTSLWGNGNSTIQHFFLVAKVRVATFTTFWGALGTDTHILFTGATAPNTSWLIGGGNWPSGSSYYRDNILDATYDAGNLTTHIYEGQFPSSITDRLTAGMDRNNQSRCLDVDIFEIVTYSRLLTSTERTGVLTYLKNKWATP